MPSGTAGTKVRVLPPRWLGEAALAGGAVSIGGLCMGLRWELLEEYAAELRALEQLPSTKKDDAARERRDWLVRVVADIKDGVMSPVVLFAIRERKRT
jgi:hypothetical protein